MTDDRTSPGHGGTLVGVGVGPGDPELLTRRALRVLASADRVVAPTLSPHEVGRAESIVRAAMPQLPVHRVVFDMTPDGEAQRKASHRKAARALLPWLGAGAQVAFVTLGDPNIYSTFSALVTALRELGWRGTTSTVPGITAFQALASQAGTVLLDGAESLSLVTAVDGTATLERALEDPERAIVVYKGGRHLPAIARLLEAHGRLEGAVLGERLGLAGEHVEMIGTSSVGEASYLATVIVPCRRDARATADPEPDERTQ